jgi:hypothetical protein
LAPRSLQAQIREASSTGETIMDRDYASAVWADNHRHLSTGIVRFFKSIAHAFRRLNAIEYDAPWRHMRP